MDITLLKKFDQKTVLITGATGFVGGRLVELLAEHTTATIKVLLRDYGKAMRLGRYPVQFIKGDLNEDAQLGDVVRGCDYVLHCAYGNKGSVSSRNQVNVQGTLSLLQAAKEEKVKSFVFLSTVSVYGLPETEWIDEQSPAKPLKDDAYAVSKLEAENLVLDFAGKNNFHAVVLQPTAVYGPWSPSYVIRPLNSMLHDVFPLIEDGTGTCNAVYVDDLCQAIFLAALTSDAAGQKFLINGPEYFNWEEYYSSLAGCLEGTMLGKISAVEMNKRFKATQTKKPIYKIALRLLTLNKESVRELLQYKFFSDLAGFIIKHMPPKMLQKIRPAASAARSSSNRKMMVMDNASVRFFSSVTKINHSKALKELNYKPVFTKQKSFESIKKWAAWYFNVQ